MFEHHSQPLLSRFRFLRRLLGSVLAGVGVIAGSLLAGMAGYHAFERLDWTDSFLNASMILSGMGPLHSPVTAAGKLFAGMYALYSGFVVIVATGVVFAPVVHRLLHRFLAQAHQLQHHRAVQSDGVGSNLARHTVVER